jgi:hypothetical protein
MVRIPKGLPSVATLIVIPLAAVLVFVLRADGKDRPTRAIGYGQVRFNGLGPERWARRYRLEHREAEQLRTKLGDITRDLRRQRKILLKRPQVAEAINLSCAVYGYCSTLWRKASCETGGTFSATSHNPSGASGLFQFLRSTWDSTPFARFSIWSPYANALAAGWMHYTGRGGEWTCR